MALSAANYGQYLARNHPLHGRLLFARQALTFPRELACRHTLKRRLNLYRSRYEHARVRTRLRSYPFVLVVEPTNRCNLRCPYCFTGAGGLGRRSSVMSPDLFRKLMDELGGYLLLVKFYNWGEPLLCKHLMPMVAEAHARGIATVVNTNFSLPFAPDMAERVARSGLDELVISIDGATQETYERYRVGGTLERVLANVRLLAATKARLGAVRPRLILEFHAFPWNELDAPGVRQLAAELGMALRQFKGVMPGPEWGVDGPWRHCGEPKPFPCTQLWSTAVVAADGGVAPCNGTFYAEDDMGRIAPDALERTTFHAIWNNERYQLARRFYRARDGTPEEQAHVCFDCPNTVLYARWKAHCAGGGDPHAFEIDLTSHDTWNYFWNRRPGTAVRQHAG